MACMALTMPLVESMQALLTCKGPGLQCLVAWAMQDVFLAPKPKRIPPQDIEFDVRGRVEAGGES